VSVKIKFKSIVFWIVSKFRRKKALFYWANYSTLEAPNNSLTLGWETLCYGILIYIQQDATLHSLFYLETALYVSGGTTTHHQERKQLYLQHVVFVTTLLLSAIIVEELEQVCVSCGWCILEYNYDARTHERQIVFWLCSR